MFRPFLLLCLLGAPVMAERDRTFAAELNLDVDEHKVGSFEDHHNIKANFTLEEFSNSSTQRNLGAKRFLARILRSLNSPKSRTMIRNSGAGHLKSVVMMQRPWKTNEVIIDVLGFTGFVKPALLTVCAAAQMKQNVEDGDWCRFKIEGIEFVVQLGSLGTALAASICGMPPLAKMALKGTAKAWGLVYNYLLTKCGSNLLRDERVPLLSQCYEVGVGPPDDTDELSSLPRLTDLTEDLPSDEWVEDQVDRMEVGPPDPDWIYNPLQVSVAQCGFD